MFKKNISVSLPSIKTGLFYESIEKPGFLDKSPYLLLSHNVNWHLELGWYLHQFYTELYDWTNYKYSAK